MGRNLLRIFFVAAIAGAAFLIHRAVSQYSLNEILDSLVDIPALRIVAALLFMAASYLCLTMFDWLALKYAGKPQAWRRAALASFASLSIGHTIGIAALSSGAIRYRYYSRWGLDAGDVAKVILFSGATVALGLATLGGIGLILYPKAAEGLFGLPRHGLMILAASCLAVPAVYILLAAIMRGTLRIWRWRLVLPAWPIAVRQVAVGTANYACVAACLHQLLAAFSDLAFLRTASVYVAAQVTSLVSHVPGGLGVLEASVIYLLGGDSALGALVAFRAVYFLLPLALGVPLFLLTGVFSAFGERPAERKF